MKINTHRTGLALSLFAGLVHIIWSFLVLVGLAQPFLNFVLNMHFLSQPYTVLPFNWGKALLLTIIALIVGYVVGTVFGMIWNWVTKN